MTDGPRSEPTDDKERAYFRAVALTSAVEMFIDCPEPKSVDRVVKACWAYQEAWIRARFNKETLDDDNHG